MLRVAYRLDCDDAVSLLRLCNGCACVSVCPSHATLLIRYRMPLIHPYHFEIPTAGLNEAADLDDIEDEDRVASGPHGHASVRCGRVTIAVKLVRLEVSAKLFTGHDWCACDGVCVGAPSTPGGGSGAGAGAGTCESAAPRLKSVKHPACTPAAAACATAVRTPCTLVMWHVDGVGAALRVVWLWQLLLDRAVVLPVVPLRQPLRTFATRVWVFLTMTMTATLRVVRPLAERRHRSGNHRHKYRCDRARAHETLTARWR